MRKRLLALLGGVLALILAAVGLGVGLSSTTATPTGPEAASAADETATTELTTLATTGDDEEADDESRDTVPATQPAPPPATRPSGAPSEDAVDEEGGDEGEELPTLPADTTAPVTYWQLAPSATVKGGTIVPIRLRAQGEAEGTIIAKTIELDGAVIGSLTSLHRNYDVKLDTTGLADGVHTLRGVASDPSGNTAEATATFVVDGTGPAVTVKPDMSTGGPTAYSRLSLKLHDAGKVDRVEINGQTKDLTDNVWSDVNFLQVGSFGIQDGVPFTVVAYDVLGNSSTQTFTLDATAPTITVKPESVGGPSIFRTLSLKLYDRFQIDYVTINGQKKDLTNNAWSDVNGLKVGQFGIQDGVPFTVVAFDVAGNSTSQTFTLDASGPTITVKPESVGGPNAYKLLSLKLHDPAKVDYVTINGTKKELTNNVWSDVNGLKVGQYGIQDNVPFEVVAFDVLGNSTTATFVFDHTGPTITVKPESVGGPNYYSSLSLKLYDAYQIDYVTVNGYTKDLTNNAWSDVNAITTGQYGITDGTPFTVVAYDVLGNSSSATFTLDGTAPTATEKSRTATSVSLKLFDKFQIDYVIINGVAKDLIDNQWSDANDITVGTFGIQPGIEFSVVVVDVAGNRATYWFTLGEVAATDPEPVVTNLTVPAEEAIVPTEEETASE
ncbi:hypothetical protein [Pseudolysinimonas sp.]